LLLKVSLRVLLVALILAIGTIFTLPASIGEAAETGGPSATRLTNTKEAGNGEALPACLECCSQRMVECLEQSGVMLCFKNFYQQCADNCRSEGETPSEWVCWQPEE
jgi:hypothetical protein